MEASVIKALQKAVKDAVNGAIPVKYIAINFKKPDEGAWLEVAHRPNTVLNEHWGPEKTYRGLLRLIVHYPMNGEGIYDPVALGESIVAHFAKGSKFVDSGGATVKITDVPDYMGPMEDPPELLLPWSIQYEFFAA